MFIGLNLIYFAFSLLEEMKVYFDFDMNIPSSDTILINEIGQWLRMAGSNTKVVIVLDALNQLDDGTGEHGMWLMLSKNLVFPKKVWR